MPPTVLYLVPREYDKAPVPVCRDNKQDSKLPGGWFFEPIALYCLHFVPVLQQ